MIFWNVSIVTVLILAMIKLLRVLWFPKHGRLSDRKFLSGGNTWKTMATQVFKNKPKSCMVAMATSMRDDWWNWTFLMENTIKEKSQSSNSKLQAVLKIFCGLGEGGTNCPPGLNRVQVSKHPCLYAILMITWHGHPKPIFFQSYKRKIRGGDIIFLWNFWMLVEEHWRQVLQLNFVEIVGPFVSYNRTCYKLQITTMIAVLRRKTLEVFLALMLVLLLKCTSWCVRTKCTQLLPSDNQFLILSEIT